jgi:predicted glycosyltransferase
LANFEQALIVFLPRIKAQADWVKQFDIHNLLVPKNTLNGPNLLYSADIVISGGGTMNREAAILGTPTYTVFKGKLGAVDQFLINDGRMTQIAEVKDIEKIKVEKKSSFPQTFIRKEYLVKQVTDLILL